jgi:creatinine amidohydrolase
VTDTGPGRRLADHTTVEVRPTTASPLLIVPLGATEQHGAHLPLGTDTLIATAWADAVADRLDDCSVAPALAYGSSGEHQDFAGTLSIGSAALELVLIELVRSARHDFGRVALLSGHAGNHDPLRRAVATLQREGHDVSGHLPRWPERTDIDAHAGLTETSLLLHLDRDRVQLDRAEPGNQQPLSELLSSLQRSGVAPVSANGVLGDPTQATPQLGRDLFDDLVNRTVELLEEPARPHRPAGSASTETG